MEAALEVRGLVADMEAALEVRGLVADMEELIGLVAAMEALVLSDAARFPTFACAEVPRSRLCFIIVSTREITRILYKQHIHINSPLRTDRRANHLNISYPLRTDYALSQSPTW